MFVVRSGFVVFAGCLMKDQNGDGVKQLDAVGKATGRLITVQLNVTSDDQVAAAVETVKAKLPESIKVLRLDLLFMVIVIYNVVVFLGSMGRRKQCWILHFWRSGMGSPLHLRNGNAAQQTTGDTGNKL